MPTTRQAPATAPDKVVSRRSAPSKRRKQGRLRNLIILCLLVGITGGAVWKYFPQIQGYFSKKKEKRETIMGPLPEINAFGRVDVPKKVTRLVPSVPGRVEEIFVQENVKVEKGAKLFRLDDFEAQNQVKQAEVALATAKALLTKAKRAPAQHQKLIEQQQSAIEAVEQKLKGAKLDLDLKERNAKGGTTRAIVERDQAKLIVESLEVEKRAKQRALEALQLTDPQDEVALAQNKVELSEARLALAKKVRDEHIVKAPYNGYILVLHINVGDTLSPESRMPALDFASTDRLIVRAEVEQEYADQVDVGMEADIVDDARGAMAWQGKVTRISRWFDQRRSTIFEPRQRNDIRTLECIIEFNDPEAAKGLEAENKPGSPFGPLRIGQRVRVTIKTNTGKSKESSSNTDRK